MHIHIHLDRRHPENTRVELDGNDITKHVLHDGFNVHMSGTQPVVSLHLMPESVTVDGDVTVDIGPVQHALVEQGWLGPPGSCPNPRCISFGHKDGCVLAYPTEDPA